MFLLLLSVSISVGFQGWRTLINNFAVEDAHLNGFWIGILQSIREIPGFLCLFVIFILLFCKEYRLISHSTLTLGIGVALTGFFPSHAGLIITTLIMSVGFHYFETTRQSLVLQNFNHGDAPLVLGALNSLTAVVNIIVGLAILLLDIFFNMKQMFLCIGIVVILLAVGSYFINTSEISIHPQHKKLILRKKYWLFYILNFFEGARRQIFVVFAVFLLVDHFKFSVQLVTLLFVINNIVNYFAASYVAGMINKIGEKHVLLASYTILFFIFLSYAVFDSPWVAAFLYILDNVLFNTSIAVRTYFQKTADKADIAPSMAVGYTINHICAVFFPFIGGALWMISIKIPFLLGATIAVLSVIFILIIHNAPPINGKKTAQI
jgi:hypothetical protein